MAVYSSYPQACNDSGRLCHTQNIPREMGKDFDYAEAAKTLAVDALKKDIEEGRRPRKTGGQPTTATMDRSSSA